MMLVGAGKTLSSHPLDMLIADPSGKPPMCSAEQFAELADVLVADAAPRLFAVLQEYGERVDVRIAAWGMAFGERAEVISTDRSLRMSVASAEEARRAFSWGSHISGRVVWASPSAIGE
ncbi:hypothetical protein ACH347_06590 [Saccharopolyspora sp. 5N102]|uniref:hypothetical protein n=1 Tax=Saccharopolyspora sp. 5N102 TaxID=3375155 RepID=UPI00379D1938